jgi:hypothetical protein
MLFMVEPLLDGSPLKGVLPKEIWVSMMFISFCYIAADFS